jgi:hypothetical protein
VDTEPIVHDPDAPAPALDGCESPPSPAALARKEPGYPRQVTKLDPLEHLRAVSAENLRLRELLAVVAQDLERIACEERYAADTAPLSERAMRIRRYLHEGWPALAQAPR